jgi:hypothetical protein
MRQHFSEEEANAILRKAIDRQPLGDEMTREQLEKTAAELGISSEALRRAEVEWQDEEEEKGLRAAFEADRRAAFWNRLPRALGGCAFMLFFLLLATRRGGSGLSVALMMALFVVGMKLVARGASAYMRGPDYERLFLEWRDERDRADVPNHFSPNAYAAPDTPRRMRRRVPR